MKYYSVLLMMVLGLSSCSHKLSPGNALFSGEWVLIELKGNPVQVSGTDRDAHLQFFYSDKKVSGSGGCNRITGTYEANKKGAMSFGPMASTRMICPDSKFEDEFLKVLGTVDRYSLGADELELKKDKKTVAKFIRR